jgi:hypothetical protein
MPRAGRRENPTDGDTEFAELRAVALAADCGICTNKANLLAFCTNEAISCRGGSAAGRFSRLSIPQGASVLAGVRRKRLILKRKSLVKFLTTYAGQLGFPGISA